MNILAAGGQQRSTRFRRKLILTLLTLLGATDSWAGIQISTQELYVHDSSGLVATLNSSSAGYFSSLDGNQVGDFGWAFTNTGLNPLTNVKLLVFLDADLDRDDNTFFNEYGEFIALSLPPGAGVGAIAASAWEIDEPGFLFGDILTNLSAGLLDNSNGVPSSTPDDVSLALLFSIGGLDPGRAVTLRMTVSTANIDGLRQVDPDSQREFYFNGSATVDLAPSGGEVPEPGTWIPVAVGLCALISRKRGS